MGLVNNRWKPDDALSDVIADVVGAAHLRGVTVSGMAGSVLVERTP
jgi:hypothetical protein